MPQFQEWKSSKPREQGKAGLSRGAASSHRIAFSIQRGAVGLGETVGGQAVPGLGFIPEFPAVPFVPAWGLPAWLLPACGLPALDEPEDGLVVLGADPLAFVVDPLAEPGWAGHGAPEVEVPGLLVELF